MGADANTVEAPLHLLGSAEDAIMHPASKGCFDLGVLRSVYTQPLWPVLSSWQKMTTASRWHSWEVSSARKNLAALAATLS